MTVRPSAVWRRVRWLLAAVAVLGMAVAAIARRRGAPRLVTAEGDADVQTLAQAEALGRQVAAELRAGGAH